VNLAEAVQLVSFVILGLMMIGGALGVVLLSSIVYSAFLLGAVFISMAGMYLLLNADFVAAAQILIYVGAINVLILFAIMLVNKQQDFAPLPNGGIRKAFTALVSVGLLTLLTTMILATPWSYSTSAPTGESTLVLIGEHFFSDFLLPFELASILLLIAMVGSIILARREYIPDQLPISELPQTILTLPERPRELVSTTSITDQNT
jgi:NAD(P)H-quinone oxidoreductase subunit 6